MRTLAWTLLCSSVTDKEPQEGLGQGKDVSVTRVILTSVQKSVFGRGGFREAGDVELLGEGTG